MNDIVKNKLINGKYFLKSFLKIKPKIFLAGLQKCGTTSLYNYLIQHDSILHGDIKENNILSKKNSNLQEYLSYFPYYKKNKKAICGSHQLTYFPFGLKRIKYHFPEAKILLIVRNPIDRAYSAYQHGCRHSKDSKFSFEEWVDVELEILNNLKDISNINEIFESTKWRGYPENSWDINERYSAGMYLSRGIYANYINEIKNLSLSFHITSLEELSENPKLTLNKIFDFLQLKNSNKIDFKVFNSGSYEREIDSSTIEKLNKFYSPHNNKFFQLISKKFNWN